MKRISLKQKSHVYYKGQQFEVVNPVSLSQVLIRNCENNEVLVVETTELLATRPDSTPEKSTLPEYIPEAKMKIARDRFEIVKPLLEEGRTKEMVAAQSKQFNKHPATLYRWLNRYNATQSILSLLPGYDSRGGKGKSRIDPATDAIVTNVIDAEYLTLRKKSYVDVHIEITRRCRIAKLPPPSLNTVRSRIRQISAKTISKRRLGRKASLKFQSAEGSFPSVRFPLDIIQVDHTPLDIILVDDIHREPIGKAYLTVAIDVYSRMVYGFYITLDSPSFFSLGQTLTQAILPKDNFLKRLGITAPWEIYGLPKTIHADNAGEFRSEDFRLFFEEYSIEMTWRPVARPEYGGHIERLAGTLNKAIHTLPGTTFSNIQERGEYKSDKEACFTIGEIEQWLANYIIETYHNKFHSAIGMTPRQKYEIGILGDDKEIGIGLPDIIEDQERLRLFLLPSFERTIQREGVSINGIKYFHDSLRRWVNVNDAKGLKHKFIFKRDPRDISRLYFYDPELCDHFIIPYRNIGYPPMSEWDLRNVRKYLNDHKIKDANEDQIFQAYEKRKKIENDALNKTKQVRRARSAASFRHNKLQADKALCSKAPIRSEVTKSVESAFEDLFSDVKPFEGIEIVRPNQEEGNDDNR